MVDVKKPLVPQIRKMTNKEFMTFTKRPRHMDDIDGITFYDDHADEADSKFDFIYDIYFVLPVVALWFYIAYYLKKDKENIVRDFSIAFFLGVVIIWTYIEYI